MPPHPAHSAGHAGQGSLRSSIFDPVQSDNVELRFTEERIGLKLRGVDAHGAEAEHHGAPCFYVEVNGVQAGSPGAFFQTYGTLLTLIFTC